MRKEAGKSRKSKTNIKSAITMKCSVLCVLVLSAIVHISFVSADVIRETYTIPCNPTAVDSAEFYKEKSPCLLFDKRKSALKKKRGVIKVNGHSFVDDKSDWFYCEYNYEGRWRDWVLISCAGYNEEEYYLINEESGVLDTLVGKPKIYGDKILCIEGSHTDWDGGLEIWEIDRKFTLCLCKLRLKEYGVFSVDDIYLAKDTLYVKYNSLKYLKVCLRHLHNAH